MVMTNSCVVILLGAIGLYLLHLLSPILTPFLVGALLAYLGNPLVDRLTKLNVPRLLSVIIVFAVLFLTLPLAIILLVPLLDNQITSLIAVFPAVVDWLQHTVLPRLHARLGDSDIVNIEIIKTTLAENWTKVGVVINRIFITILHSGMAFAFLLADIVLIPVVTFYLLRDWQKLLKCLRDILPRRIEPTVIKLLKECDAVLSDFFRGQFLVMIVVGIYYSVGLTAIGLSVGIIIGIVIGVLSIVPLVGFILGMVVSSIIVFIQYGTFFAVSKVLLLFLVGQLLENSVFTPVLVGKRVGLHPVAVIFAILAGGALFGFTGILLAVPVASVLMVWLRFLNAHYHKSHYYR